MEPTEGWDGEWGRVSVVGVCVGGWVRGLGKWHENNMTFYRELEASGLKP